MSLRRWWPWLALGLVVVVAVAITVWPRGGQRTAVQRRRDLAAEIKCPECQGLSMGDSDSTTARAARADITARIAHGESDAQIRQAYVDRYGESILLKPEATGIGLIVWALPVAAFVAAAGGLVIALRRWRREPRLQATDADRRLVESMRSPTDQR